MARSSTGMPLAVSSACHQSLRRRNGRHYLQKMDWERWIPPHFSLTKRHVHMHHVNAYTRHISARKQRRICVCGTAWLCTDKEKYVCRHKHTHRCKMQAAHLIRKQTNKQKCFSSERLSDKKKVQ